MIWLGLIIGSFIGMVFGMFIIAALSLGKCDNCILIKKCCGGCNEMD